MFLRQLSIYIFLQVAFSAQFFPLIFQFKSPLLLNFGSLLIFLLCAFLIAAILEILPPNHFIPSLLLSLEIFLSQGVSTCARKFEGNEEVRNDEEA